MSNKWTCVILAGGFGTRLSAVVSDVPKSMAMVANKPFLEHLVAQIKDAGCDHLVLCVGYRAEVIENYFGEGSRHGIRIIYSKEAEPLGTAGALAKARALIQSDPFIVLNGDTFCPLSIPALMEDHLEKKPAVTISAVYMKDASSYGSLMLGRNGEVTEFSEKDECQKAGYVNAGVYVFCKTALDSVPPGHPYSMEYSLLPSLINRGINAFKCQGPFIDIGTPASFLEAQTFLAKYSHL